MKLSTNMIKNWRGEPILPPIPICSVKLNVTNTFMLKNYGFDCLELEKVEKIWKDGRIFAHMIEPWLSYNYPIKHIGGCKKYDFGNV